MRKTSVRELHIHTSELVREAAEGGTIVIERRGEPVAELRPITTPSRLADDKKAEIFESMRAIWGVCRNSLTAAKSSKKIATD